MARVGVCHRTTDGEDHRREAAYETHRPMAMLVCAPTVGERLALMGQRLRPHTFLKFPNSPA